MPSIIMVVMLALIIVARTVYDIRMMYVIALVVVWVWAFYVFVVQKRFAKLNQTLDRPTPTMGWQKWAWRTLRILQMHYVPAFGMSEQVKIEGTRHRGHRNTKRAEIGIFGPKGGVGKSTVATILAYLSVMFSQSLTLLCDVRQKRGNLAERFGLDRRSDPLQLEPYTTVTLRQAIELFKAGYFWNAAQVQTIIGSVPGMQPLQVIASIMGGKNVKTAFNKTELSDTLDELTNTYTLVVHEAPDELEDYIDLELMRRIDIPIFVHRVNMQNSRAELLDALGSYMGYPEFRDKIRTNGRLLVLGTHKKDTKEKFARMFGFKPEHIFMIPFSKFYDSPPEPDPESDEAVDLHQEFDKSKFTQTNRLTDVDNPPEPALDIPKMPRRAMLEYMRCMNSGLESQPAEVLTARPPAELATPAPQPKGSES